MSEGTRRTAKPVREQSNRVSTATSTTPSAACAEESEASLRAWAIGAVPHPASLESNPRITPKRSAVKAETVPPLNAQEGVKAL